MQKEELRRRYQQGLQELQRNNRGFQIFTRETWEVGEHPSGYGEFESAFAARHVNQIKPKAVLDIGSYRHFVLGLLGMYDVTTLDVRHREQSCPNETVIVCDAKKLDLPDCSYDLVVSLSSIEHFGLGRYGDEIDLDGDIKAVKEMIRVLKPGGRLIISTTITHTAPSIVFNAHRVYSFEKLQAMFRELMYVEEAFFSRELQASCTREQITQKPGEWDSYCGCWEKPGRVEGIEEPQASVQKVSKIEIQSLKVPNSSETLKALCKTPHPINPEIIAPLAITDSAEAVEALFYDHLPFPNENQTQVFRNYLRLVEIVFHAGCRAVLELGTGYSTSLWARYAERTGAEVVSLDVHADRILERLQPCGEAERIRRSVKVVQAASITAQDLESFYLSKPRTEFCGVQVKEMLMYIAALTSQVCDKDLYNAVVNLVGGANSHPAAILLPDENHLHFPKELLRLYAQGQNFRNELDFLDTLTEKMPVGVLDQWIAEGRTWDFIFFDSGEFPGMVEWSKLKSSIVPGGFAALHDIFFPKSIKSMLVAASLFADPDWRVVLLDNSTWQGMLVAQRVR